jgi:hypothetical protein
VAVLAAAALALCGPWSAALRADETRGFPAIRG